MLDSLLDALGYAGEALNKPGRAVRGVLAGNPDELAAAIPFSDSLGITNQSASTSGKDLLSALGLDVGSGTMGDIAGFGAEVATDPLAWMGAGLGSRLGGAAERAAVARGPQFGTTADDLSRMLSGSLTGDIVESKILQNPQASRILSEINPESQFIGNGVEALAFKEPSGSVTRIGSVQPGAAGRPIAPGIAQPNFTQDIGAASPFRVERGIPYADRVNDVPFWTRRDSSTMLTQSDMLDRSLLESGLKRTDRHFGNIGMIGERPVAIDPGDIATLFGAKPGATQPVLQAAEPGMMMNTLLDALGSSQSIRSGESPRYQALLSLLGGGGGAVTGAFGRAGQ